MPRVTRTMFRFNFGLQQCISDLSDIHISSGTTCPSPHTEPDDAGADASSKSMQIQTSCHFAIIHHTQTMHKFLNHSILVYTIVYRRSICIIHLSVNPHKLDVSSDLRWIPMDAFGKTPSATRVRTGSPARQQGLAPWSLGTAAAAAHQRRPRPSHNAVAVPESHWPRAHRGVTDLPISCVSKLRTEQTAYDGWRISLH